MANEINRSEKFIEIQNVRISPPCIVFEDNFAKKHMAKFIMQNVGKSKVFIRTCEPLCPGYSVHCFPRGKYISPGLRIITTVKLICEDDTPTVCFIPIYINDEKIDYEISLEPLSTSVTVTPSALEFGKINVGTIQLTRTLLLENKGPRELIFFVDLRQCSDFVSVDPVKGRLKSWCVVALNVKLISFIELKVDSYISIRYGQYSIRVPIKACVVLSRLEVMHPNATQHFTLLEFPPTYFGVRSVVNMYVKNYSAISHMFATTGEVHHQRFNLDDLMAENINFKFFSIYPSDGMFQEDETKLFRFTFSPKEIDATIKYIRFYFSTIVMHRFRCGSLNIEGNVFEDLRSDLKSLSSFSQSGKQSASFDLPAKLSEVNYSSSDSHISIENALDADEYYRFNLETAKDFIRMHLYATAEVASIDIIPESITVKGMSLQKCETRVIELRNKSKHLPIYLQYVRIPYVHLEKELIHLEPSASVQITIRIVPGRGGNIETEIIFQLMFHDVPRLEKNLKVVGRASIPVAFDVITVCTIPKPQINFGITPNYIKEVGKNMLGVKFNTKLQKAKAITVHNCTKIDPNCDDVVVFPNDTQRSLRPWRAYEAYRTIFTRTARYIAPLESQYELNIVDYALKKEVNNYYTNYARTRMKKAILVAALELNTDYQVTKEDHILCTDLVCPRCPKFKIKKDWKSQCFIPLTPGEMDNIIIYPTIVQTRQIATNSFYKFRISIKNNNLYPIRLLVTSDKPNIVYFAGNRYTIGSKEYITIKMYYKTTYQGYYTSNLYLIVNESTVLSVPILAEVVSRMLAVDSAEIIFDERTTHKFVKLENRLNVDVPFTWVLVNPNFTVEPSSGIVPIRHRIMCVARYHTDIDGPLESEAQMLSGITHSQKIKMRAKIASRTLTSLYPTVEFGYIPLNDTVPNVCFLRNSELIHVIFNVDSTDIPFGLRIFPLSGTVGPTSIFTINVRAKFTNCVEFEYIIKIQIVNGDTLEVPVRGTVVYPDITISPNIFNLAKIPASMVTSMKFSVKNNSMATAYIQFDMKEYQEYCISDTDSPWDYHRFTDIVVLANETKILYIHFYPVDASSAFFYLPIIINNILGPPLFTDTISTKVNYYLTDIIEDCAPVYIERPLTIPCVQVRTLATPGKISISMTRIKFFAVAMKHDFEYSLKISNPQNEPESVCLRVEHVEHPVYVEYESSNSISRTKCAIVLSLAPKEKVVLTVAFRPSAFEFGKHRVLIPVYLRSDMTLEEHTVIVVEAEYERPKIISTCDEEKSHLQKFPYNSDYIFTQQPVPPKCSLLNFSQPMVFINHLSDCKIRTGYTENVIVTILEDTKRMISKNAYSVVVQLRDREVAAGQYKFNCVVSLSCSCGGIWERHIEGAIDNSLYTTYRFFKSYPSLQYATGYPFFVDSNDDGYSYMNDCLSAAEQWLHTQVFFGQMGYEIGDNMSFANFEPATEETIKMQTQLSRIPLLHILGNMLGQQILTPIPSDLASFEDKVKGLIPIYSNIIDMLEQHGAVFTYLRPEFLLNFNFYRLYKELYHIKKERPYTLTDYITTYDDFIKLSQQSWLDITLQIFKSIYLKNLMKEVDTNRDLGKLTCTPLIAFFDAEHVRKHPNYISDSGSLVLNWLEYHYMTNKHLLLPDLSDIEVDLFNGSLSNGLVFAIVLITYCPYLTPYLKDFFDCPESPEQLSHNAIIVIQSLEMTNYSFKMTPDQINQSNPLRMLMFSTYLFEVLPNMYPSETLTIRAGLSTKSSEKVELTNSNDFPIAYKVLFIPNSSGIFTTPKLVYVIPPQKKIYIVITYWARYAKPIERTLLLSGEITGYRYATNKCITLLGVPELNHATTTITYARQMFIAECVEFLVQSPYKTAAIYDVQQTYETLHEPFELSSIIYHFERNRIGTARLVTTNKTFNFDEKGQCVIHAIIGMLVKATIKMWLFFRNETVGDFAVKVVTVARDSTRNETLVVTLPKYVDLQERPDSLYLRIPNRSLLFFDCMKSLLVNLTEGDESKLWKRIVETPMGTNILENLFSTTDPNTRKGTPIRCESAVYTVVVQEDSDVILPETLVFHDECSSGFLKVPLQLKNTASYPKDFTFTMESTATLRKRYYYVKFVYNGENMQSNVSSDVHAIRIKSP